MKKIILVCLILIVSIVGSIFIFNIEASAIEMVDPVGSHSGWSTKTETKKDKSGNIYICSEFYKQTPGEGVKCDVDKDWDKYSTEALAIGWILQSDQTYIAKELEINALLAKRGYTYYCSSSNCVGSGLKGVTRSGFDGNKNWTNTSYYISINDPNNNILNMVNEALNYANDNVNKGKLAASVEGYGYSNNKYTINVSVSGSQDSNYTVSYNKTCRTTNRTKNSFVAECDNPGNVDITITNTTQKHYTSIRYDCGEDYQKLFKLETATFSPSITLNAKINSCEEDLSANTSIDARIAIYKKYGSQFKNILKTSGASCNSKIEPINPQVSCLNSIYYVPFSNTNLSNYTEAIDVDGVNTAYCLTAVNFDKKTTINFSKNLTVKAGTIIPGTFNTIATTAKITTKCYDPSNTFEGKELDYSNYISDVKLGQYPLTIKNDNSDKKIKLTYNKKSGLYEGSTTIDYYFWNIYFKNNLTGRYINSLEEVKESERKNYTNYGTGLITKFTDYSKNNELYTLDFSYKHKNKNDNKFTLVSADCYYSTEKGLVEKEEEKDKQKLRLEFRLIDTSNPFPGKSASGRKVGRNWCSDNNCQNNNDLITEVILNKPNSYGRIPSTKESKNPIYEIKLTSKNIKEIREYNKNNPYDDYTLKCDSDGTNCESTFLKDRGMTRLS